MECSNIDSFKQCFYFQVYLKKVPEMYFLENKQYSSDYWKGSVYTPHSPHHGENIYRRGLQDNWFSIKLLLFLVVVSLNWMNSVGSKNPSLKCHMCTPSGCIDIGIRKFEFVKKKLSSFTNKNKTIIKRWISMFSSSMIQSAYSYSQSCKLRQSKHNYNKTLRLYKRDTRNNVRRFSSPPFVPVLR